MHAYHRYTKKICLLEVVNYVISFPELNFSSQNKSLTLYREQSKLIFFWLIIEIAKI